MFYIKLLYKTLPALSRALSSSFLGAFVIFFRFTAFLFWKKIFKGEKPWSFSLIHKGRQFQIKLFEGSPDIAALKEIFLDKEYDWEGMPVPAVILDLGAHIGNTALYFHLQYPDAEIYAVEASPMNYSRLVENVGEIKKIKPIFGAVSDRDGSVTLYESESSLGTSLYRREGEVEGVEVPAFTMDTLFRTHGLSTVDFMKVDIEGAEERIFREHPPDRYGKYFIVEVHNDLFGKGIDFEKEYFEGFQNKIRPLHSPDRHLLYAKRA